MVNVVHFDNLHTNLSPAKLDCGKLAVLAALLDLNLAIYFQRPTESGVSAIVKTIESREEYAQIITIIQTLITKVNTEHGLQYPPYCENYAAEIWKVWTCEKGCYSINELVKK
ncbi:hypothetical protein CUC43_31605 (plasmid) [Bacillus thuringiensis LM1212]|uniref:hypothetical protein n=1 Tax=Bacillus cereus group TaxID=86661 RepID=UPI000423488C|nr:MULTISPECIES: hypothetical protein [Bacillus cereus group]AXY11207.1 hypothetical protein CUC43_31605 [Bacillus thuringiensis LM1212]QDF27410.1 hypothetical protein FJR70_32170 [Bacillus tropicus]QUG99090.1 hypothetical protein HCM98_29930 [Bacillus tropicus]